MAFQFGNKLQKSDFKSNLLSRIKFIDKEKHQAQ